jgi:outer membrane protein assembly factor BamB
MCLPRYFSVAVERPFQNAIEVSFMCRTGSRIAFLLIGGILLAGQAPAADPTWPRFRGPNGAGISADKDIPVQWTKANILWEKVIPGLGNSSPVVWGNRLFLQSASKDGKERMLLCLNTVDGTTVWSVSVPASPSKTHAKNTLASSTPAVDGECVYALFYDGENMVLHAYDMKGNSLWDKNLGSYKSQHGPGTSPMVYQGKVYVANDQDGSAMTWAFEGQTGKVLWKAKREGYRACYSVPLLVERPGVPAEIVVASTMAVTSYDPTTGEVNWNWTTWPWLRMPLRTVASPLFTQGLLVVSSGDGSGERNTVAVKPQGKGALTNDAIAWMKTKTFPYVPNMLAHGEHLYFVNDNGIAGCVATLTGEMVWNERLGGTFSASPILIDGKVYAVSEDGVVTVFNAATKFERLARNELDEGVIATPAVADNRLFIRGKTHLYCIARVATSSR